MAKILVVDDDSRVHDNLRRHLIARGHTVLAAADGEEGLRVALSEQPDLVITDMAMPWMDGGELLRQLRTAGWHRIISGS